MQIDGMKNIDEDTIVEAIHHSDIDLVDHSYA
jgi:hypothetical protein